MTAFATNAEFANRLGVTLTAGEQTDADNLLALASDLIRSETGQTIDLVEDDELTRRGSPGSRIRLPQRPVVDVTAVTLAGVAVSSDDWYVEGDELVRSQWDAGNQAHFGFGGSWGQPTQELVITYTHGYSTIPGVVKAVCLEMVVRAWVNPGTVLAETHGSESVTYQRSNGLLLTDDERRALNDTVRYTSGTVVLR